MLIRLAWTFPSIKQSEAPAHKMQAPMGFIQKKYAKLPDMQA